MLRILGIVFLVLIIGFVAILAMGYFQSNTERGLARAFIERLSDKDIDGMKEMMAPELAASFPYDGFEEAIETAKPFTEISFSGFASDTGGTRVDGTATTADGCESPVNVSFANEMVIGFDVESLCYD